MLFSDWGQCAPWYATQRQWLPECKIQYDNTKGEIGIQKEKKKIWMKHCAVWYAENNINR